LLRRFGYNGERYRTVPRLDPKQACSGLGPALTEVRALAYVLGCVLALSGCGSSSSSGTGSGGSAGHNAGVQFADCMRSHGVSNFPDPSAGGGIKIPNGSRIDPQSPAFRSAQGQCSKYLPGGGGPGQASERDKLRMLKMAQCMREHGFSTFPDPTATPPPPGTGFAIAFGLPGSFIAIPQALVGSPGFQRAAGGCGLPGVGPHGQAQAAPAG
jgi:hypothetical protein